MFYQWGRKDPFTPAVNAKYDNTSELQIYNATGIPITKGTNGIGTTDEQFKYDNTTITTINNLIQNPSTHYVKGDGIEANWVPIASAGYNNITKEGDWWNPTIKTLYDPCPNGYRIPKYGTYGEGGGITIHPGWSPWIDNELKAGRTFENSSFFPASGLRSNANGQFWGGGIEGLCWTSTMVKSTLGYALNFTSNNINFNGNLNDARSFGFPARCIKD